MKIPFQLYSKFMTPLQGQKCLRCGAESESNTAHHIFYRSSKKLLALVKLNTESTCMLCHDWFHEDKFRAYEYFDEKYPNRRIELCEIEDTIRREKLTPQEVYERWGK